MLGVIRTARPAKAGLAGLSVVACAAVAVSGCGLRDDVMSTMGMPGPETSSVRASAQNFAIPPAMDPNASPDLIVTPAQRGFLDALAGVGVQPSSELVALSIGSYVCQARAAEQTDQAVWDSVMPMVRGEVRDSPDASVAPPAGHVSSVTADYIRIAIDKLC